jgi:hypothetical protein
MLEVLEHGAIGFLYRPRVQTDVARGIEDVQAFYVLLVPDGGRPAGLVRDLAASEYWTRTRGLRHQPGPRLAGEGAYALQPREHVHLAYALGRRRPAEVRADLRIAPEASYVVATFAHSLDPAAREVGEERRFVPLEPAHLDVPGTELVLIAAGEALLADLGSRLDPASERATTAALCRMVREASGRPPAAPLPDGICH